MASKRIEEMKDGIAPKKIKLDDDLGSLTSGIVEDGTANEHSKKVSEKDLDKYHVIAKLDILRQYWSSEEGVDALFSALMKQVGSSGSQITSHTKYSFIAFLTADQAAEMAGLARVFYVGQIIPYYPDPN